MKKRLLIISAFCLITSAGTENVYGMEKILSTFINGIFGKTGTNATTTTTTTTTATNPTQENETPGAPAIQPTAFMSELFQLIPTQEEKHAESKKISEQDQALEKLLAKEEALRNSITGKNTQLNNLKPTKTMSKSEKLSVVKKRLSLKKDVENKISSLDNLSQITDELLQAETEKLLKVAETQSAVADALIQALQPTK
jgi:hypothetical protein